MNAARAAEILSKSAMKASKSRGRSEWFANMKLRQAHEHWCREVIPYAEAVPHGQIPDEWAVGIVRDFGK